MGLSSLSDRLSAPTSLGLGGDELTERLAAAALLASSHRQGEGDHEVVVGTSPLVRRPAAGRGLVGERAQLMVAVRQRQKEGGPAGLSTTTVRATHVTISAALTYAVRKGIVGLNVAKLAARPAGRKASGKSGPPTRPPPSSNQSGPTACFPCTSWR